MPSPRRRGTRHLDRRGLEQGSPFGLGGLGLLPGRLHLDGLVETREELFGIVLDAGRRDVRRGFELEQPFGDFADRQKLVEEGDLAGVDLRRLPRLADGPAGGGIDRPGVLLEQRRGVADHLDPVWPAVDLADEDPDVARDVGRQGGRRRERAVVHPQQVRAVSPFPADDPDVDPVQLCLGDLVERDGLPQTRQHGLGAAEAQVRDDQDAEVFVEDRVFQLLEDRQNLTLAVALHAQDLLVIPEDLAVADLEHLRVRVAQPDEVELEPNPVPGILVVVPFELELLVEHVDFLLDLARDPLHEPDLDGRGVELVLGRGSAGESGLCRWPAAARGPGPRANRGTSRPTTRVGMSRE